MLKVFKVAKDKINVPVVVVSIAIIIGLLHLFSYYIPFTNNAFVATNITPIAADVSGYITKIYVKNGEVVKKNDPLIKVYRKPYRLAYEYAKARHEEAVEHLGVIQRQIQKTKDLLQAATSEHNKARIEYQYKQDKLVRQAIPVLEIRKLKYDLETSEKQKDAYQKQITIEMQQVIQQNKRIQALKAAMDNAMVNLNLTIVRAPGNGIIDNMYISPGTPIKIHKPLFSFIDTSKWWIQANFNETDLRRIRPGDKAYIVLRMYYFRKLFHGRIVNTVWAANRQDTSLRTQQQKVLSENQWLLIPQRLPLQIEILDPDPNFPLQPGMSAYVYLSANTHPREL